MKTIINGIPGFVRSMESEHPDLKDYGESELMAALGNLPPWGGMVTATAQGVVLLKPQSVLKLLGEIARLTTGEFKPRVTLAEPFRDRLAGKDWQTYHETLLEPETVVTTERVAMGDYRVSGELVQYRDDESHRCFNGLLTANDPRNVNALFWVDLRIGELTDHRIVVEIGGIGISGTIDADSIAALDYALKSILTGNDDKGCLPFVPHVFSLP